MTNVAAEQLTPIKRALLEIRDLRDRLQKAERRYCEPIAVVGIGLRFPGGARDLASLWRVLAEGKDAITEIPSGRWDRDAYFDADPLRPGKMNVRHGGFIDGVDQFDAPFFGISPREAASMDPQHRLLLEVGWEALEHAGESAPSLAGTQTGVFVGIANGDYFRILYSDPEQIDPYAASGNGFSLASGRLSYLLGVHGPSITIDTACSSSLVAVHLACQSLRLGECSVALAGGVNLILSPELHINLAKVRVLAPDGRCKSFSAAADGYARAEGCGIAVLKPLSTALADRNRILAVIRGSAVNQDGRSAGITAPNGPAQEAVIRAALKNAGLSPQDVTYVEAHGTGTALGDPIEVQALAAALGQDRTPERPLLVGAVKSNIGHSEAAAGMAGLAKAILCLQHQAIPPTVHLREKNPAVDWENLSISIPTELTPWPAGATPIIGLSSFGMSGTNAHIVLESPPAQQKTNNNPERPLHLLALSAASEPALCELAARYEAFLAQTDADLADICFTANAGRSTFAWRLAAIGQNRTEIRSSLADSLAHPRLHSAGSRPRIAFVYTGQGVQRPGMGAELYRTSTTFHDAIEECEELLRPHLDRKLTEILFPAPGDESLIDQTVYVQPAMFALQYALTQLWRSWGLEPALVAGHSLGEYAAACTAGIFSVSDGLRLVAARARLTGSLPPDGGMMAVFAPEDRVLSEIAPYASRISIGAINGRNNIVVSGGLAELDLLAAQFEATGIKCHRLKVATAYHSPLLEPILDEFEAVAQTVRYACPKVGFISNVSGTAIDAGQPLTASYWRNHLRQSVRFSAALDALYQHGIRHFLELGPKPVLSALGMDSQGAECNWYASLTPQRTDWSCMLDSLQALYLQGASVDWAGFDRDYLRNRVTAPLYPFQRQSYWTSVSRPASPSPAASPAIDSELPADKDWLYGVNWEPAATVPPDNSAATFAGRWIVFSGAHPAGHAVVNALRQHGYPVATISAGNGHEQANGHFILDPHRPADFESAIREAANGKPTHILFLWGLDCGPASNPGESAEVTSNMCAAAVNTMRGAIAQAGSRIWFVTCGAQPAGKTAAPNAEQAAIWGLGRTIALEQPDTWGGLLDLDPQDGPEQQAQWVIEATHRTGREDQLVIRDGVCLAARLARMPLCPSSNFSVKPDGSCLITGAFGGLGPRIARWLVDRGARHLVLVSRRGLPDRSSWAAQDPAGDIGQSIAAVQAMEALGVTVESVAADVAVRSQMEDLFSRFGREWPPLRGMIHAAVAATIVPVCELGNTEFLRMFSAKVTGGHHLLELGSKQPLDFVVLFSSLAGVVGSSGGAHYSAASTCLDALAHVGRSQGLPVTAISWGSWEVMRNSTEDIRKRFRAGGLIPMPFERALNIMGMVLASGVPEIIVAPVDWKAFRTIHELRRPRPLLSNMGTDAAPAAPAPETPRQNTKLRQRLSAAAAQERPQIVRQEVRQAIAHVLRIKNPDTIDGQKPLLEMGMDSLMAIELISIIRRQFAIDLPLESLFNIATVERLADKVAELLRATETPITEPTAPHTATERRLASIWEALLQRGPIGINDRFFELNGSSALRERMLAEVRRAFGVAAEGIPINALADGLTIHALARLIDESLETTSSLLVPLQTRGSRIPLFLIHAGGGYVFFYRALASRLAPDQPLYAIRAETPDDGLGRPFEQTRSIEELAARYITEIRKVSPNGPYLLGGACFGGVMAFEMAKQLQAAGEEVGPVLLFDSFVLNNKLTYSQRIARQIHYLSGRPIREVVWYAGAKTARRILPSSLLNAARALRTGPRAPLPDSPPQMTTPQWAMAQHGLPEKQRQAFETCMQTATRLLVAYKPRVYDGKIVLFKAAQSDDPVPYWTNLGREGMVIHAIPGGHLDMMEEPAVEMTASLVREHAGVQQRPSMVASLACAS